MATATRTPLVLSRVHFGLLDLLYASMDDAGIPLSTLRRLTLDGKPHPAVDELGQLIAEGGVEAVMDARTGEAVEPRSYRMVDAARPEYPRRCSQFGHICPAAPKPQTAQQAEQPSARGRNDR